MPQPLKRAALSKSAWSSATGDPPSPCKALEKSFTKNKRPTSKWGRTFRVFYLQQKIQKQEILKGAGELCDFATHLLSCQRLYTIPHDRHQLLRIAFAGFRGRSKGSGVAVGSAAHYLASSGHPGDVSKKLLPQKCELFRLLVMIFRYQITHYPHIQPINFKQSSGMIVKRIRPVVKSRMFRMPRHKWIWGRF